MAPTSATRSSSGRARPMTRRRRLERGTIGHRPRRRGPARPRAQPDAGAMLGDDDDPVPPLVERPAVDGQVHESRYHGTSRRALPNTTNRGSSASPTSSWTTDMPTAPRGPRRRRRRRPSGECGGRRAGRRRRRRRPAWRCRPSTRRSEASRCSRRSRARRRGACSGRRRRRRCRRTERWARGESTGSLSARRGRMTPGQAVAVLSAGGPHLEWSPRYSCRSGVRRRGPAGGPGTRRCGCRGSWPPAPVGPPR